MLSGPLCDSQQVILKGLPTEQQKMNTTPSEVSIEQTAKMLKRGRVDGHLTKEEVLQDSPDSKFYQVRSARHQDAEPYFCTDLLLHPPAFREMVHLQERMRRRWLKGALL